jgi:hypothetical protein
MIYNKNIWKIELGLFPIPLDEIWSNNMPSFGLSQEFLTAY